MNSQRWDCYCFIEEKKPDFCIKWNEDFNLSMPIVWHFAQGHAFIRCVMIAKQKPNDEEDDNFKNKE